LAITTLPGATATDLTTLVGTDGADVFAPSTVESNLIVVTGKKGNDSITFASSVTNSEIFAGRDNDTITISSSLESSSVSGDKGVDIITVALETFDSTLDGGDSVDTFTFTGAVSNSSVLGGSANDTVTLSGLTTGTLVNGNADEDTFTITGTLKTSTIHGGKGNDVFTAAVVTDSSLLGDLGNDDYTVTGAVTNSAINGGEGKDTIDLTAASTSEKGSLLGGAGDDKIDFNGTTGDGIFIDGGAGTDDLESTGALKDTIFGGLGKDAINVAGGAALIMGGASQFDSADGADTIVAGNGAVTIFGAAGKDNITTGTGKAVINGGLDADSITVGAGDVSINGGAGNDTVDMDHAALTSKDTISGDKGTDVLQLTAFDGAVTDAAFTGVSNFETVEIVGAGVGGGLTVGTKFSASGVSAILNKATTTATLINASAATSDLAITSTSVNLADTLRGGSGADTLSTGALGQVEMTGGKGIDQFISLSTTGTVSITDFGASSTTDTFNLTSASGTVAIAVKSDFTATSSHINSAAGAVTLTPDGVGVDINLTSSAGTKGFVIATGINDGGTKSLLTGSKFSDTITATPSGSTMTGGKGADVVAGAAGADILKMSVGDSLAATGVTLATAGTLADGDTFTFANGVDQVATFVSASDDFDFATAGATELTNAAQTLVIGTNYIMDGTITGNVFARLAAGADSMLFTATGTNLGLAASFGTNAVFSDNGLIQTGDIV
jgi:Ca2+-binding RTX toxin-like protein